MALTLPKARTLKVTGLLPNGDATGDVYELTTAVAAFAPALTIPTTFDFARNTSHQGTGSLLQNVRFMGAVVPTGEQSLVKADGSIDTDPRGITAQEAEVLVKQLTPQAKNAKYQILNWDMNVEGNNQVLAQYIASWVQVRRTRKELEIFSLSVEAAKAVQVKVLADTATAKTFATGSHTQNIADFAALTPEGAYDLFADAYTHFGQIGLDKAKGGLNKAFGHAAGIGDNDMMVYMSKAFRNKLFKYPSLLASTPGFALFQSAGLEKVDDIYIKSTNNLPEGVHLMVVSTGMSGSFAHEQVGDGIGGNIIIDPNWSKAKRLDLWDEYVLGVVYDFLIFVAGETAVIPVPTSK